MRILIFFILLLIIPFAAQAWQGKVIAVDSPTSLVVLKNSQTPVKIEISGVKVNPETESAKGKLETSSLALMKNVEVKETGTTDSGKIIADVFIDGKPLAQDLINAGVANTLLATSSSEDNIKQVKVAPAVSAESPIQNDNLNTNEIISELSEPAPEQSYRATPPPAPVVRYVQVQPQPQQLGFWPTRTVKSTPLNQPQSMQPQSINTETDVDTPIIDNTIAATSAQKPGDIAQEEHDLAIRVNKRGPIKKNKGFFVSKKKSETFVGTSFGTQYGIKPKSTVPYSPFGVAGGLSVRHFYPSGFGLGGDMLIGSASGSSGTIGPTGNATNGTAYNYKSKKFMNYTFTASLLYRFYSDRKFTPYIAAHGGYTFYDFPTTEFGLSDGAPVAGGGLGFLYEFDSGFTIGSDVRYLNTFGTKTNDPTGSLNTTINFGYTFD